MKNKEEPSVNSQRGNPCEQADLHFPDCDGPQTTGSLSRPGSTVAARTEQPALSEFSGQTSQTLHPSWLSRRG